MSTESRTLSDLMLAMARLIHRRMKANSLQKEHLSPVQVHALIAITCKRLSTMRELSRELAMTPSAVTALADGLVKSGFTKRHIDPKDRRSWHLRITPTGERLLKKRMKRLSKELEATMSVLSAAERRMMGTILKKVIDAHE